MLDSIAVKQMECWFWSESKMIFLLFCQLPCCSNVSDPCCAKTASSQVAASGGGNSTVPPSVSCRCHACWQIIEPKLHQAIKFVGIIGLLFSFTEVS